jgi:hypothetical protein
MEVMTSSFANFDKIAKEERLKTFRMEYKSYIF